MTRKMQIFYGSLVIILGFFVFAGITGVEFSSENLSTTMMWFLIWSGAMAGANVGEHFAKAKMNGKK